MEKPKKRKWIKSAIKAVADAPKTEGVSKRAKFSATFKKMQKHRATKMMGKMYGKAKKKD